MWWKNAVVYCLDVETYADGNGDGVGDFLGLTQRLDHLAGLGVTCLWLMPFYPTPNRDDGYDLTDHYAIDESLGTFGDFTEFVRTAADRGMRVISDLVVNHTSDQHPWFQEARQDPDSPLRDFYVWRDEVPEDGPHGVVFPGEQESAWTYDEVAGQYYHHRFYHHQPDLNVANEAVRDEIRKVIGFWLAQGLSGFRVDAVPFFLETDGIDETMELAPHDYLRDLCAFMTRRSGGAIMLGEVNLEPEQQREFFGDEDGDELQMLFNFIGMQTMYLSLARGDAGPLADGLRSLPDIPDEGQWATFVRNHDELTLDKLTDAEREEVFAAFGPDPDMQVYDRGLRRRLPPMLDGDERRIRLVYSLLFALPGTPTIFYGEEIGMGENLAVEGRRSVRTSMQWQPGPTGGFTSADRDQVRRPPPEGDFDPDHVNVRDQQADPDSLLNWFERMIRHRRDLPILGWGEWEVVDTGHTAVLGVRHVLDDETVLTLHNLAATPSHVDVDPDVEDWQVARDLLGDQHVEADGSRLVVDLAGHGYRWLRIESS
nr:alpha-amylase family protein [Salsipaludibacter albus]